VGERLKKGFIVTLYSMGCGLMLAIFPLVGSGINLIFSLLAFLIGIYFFRKFPSLRSRIVFFVLSLLFFFFFTAMVALIIYLQQHPLPAAAG
jgi:hypothetical protein